MNKIDRFVMFHYGILNKKKLGQIDQFDLDNPKHISVLFMSLDGYNGNRFKMAEFYIENRQEIDSRLNEIKEEYSKYLNTFKPEIDKENYYGEGIHLYTKPIDFYFYLKENLEN